MNPVAPSSTPSTASRSTAAVQAPAVASTALAALEADARWLSASEEERAVLQRIAQQRDHMAAAQQARAQAKSLRAQPVSVPADAPLTERLLVFAKLHPVATAAVAGLALMIGPRKLLRYGGMALPWLAKLKR